MERPGLLRAPWAWPLLLGLLAVLLWGAATASRDSWPGFVGDETTYLAQAGSLAFDGDLRWEKRDYDRFFAHWGRPPEGVVLQSGDGGRTISFSKPPFYALYLAPFVRLSPRHGPFVANALLLALAAVVAARALGKVFGAKAPWWVAVWVFGSVAFGSTFWAHPDLFLMSLVALALALTVGRVDTGEREIGRRLAPAGAGGRAATLAWLAAGVLLGLVAASRPVYAVLLLPAALAAPSRGRRAALVPLLGGAALVAVFALGAQQATTGSWTSYGAERRGFYARTGFPGVDFPATEWTANLERFGMSSWTGSGEVSTGLDFLPALVTWNSWYQLVGRHVGLLPYFLPLLLGFVGRPRGAARWALLLAVAAALGGLLLVRPFNFWGGGAALANRYFLPLYPAFWFLATRRRSAWWPLGAVLLAAPFLLPLWTAPRAYLRGDDGGYRFVGAAARKLLPYETTQNQLKPSGHEDFVHQGLWVKPLDPPLGPSADGTALQLQPGRDAAVLLGSEAPLSAVEVLPRGLGRGSLWVGGLEVPAAAGDGGRRRLNVPLGRPRATHPMWWTTEPFYLYEVQLRLDGVTAPVTFSLRPVGAGGG
jgi:hypothetical protein